MSLMTTRDQRKWWRNKQIPENWLIFLIHKPQRREAWVRKAVVECWDVEGTFDRGVLEEGTKPGVLEEIANTIQGAQGIKCFLRTRYSHVLCILLWHLFSSNFWQCYLLVFINVFHVHGIEFVDKMIILYI
jgi:hypothetical protein